jgi:hypothetical protein
MTEGDGAHIDITIPLFVGLKYGLQVSRQVYMHVEFGDTNHHTPYAARSKYNSNARRLGILISGTCAVGNRKGSRFSHWIQSSRGAAVGQAEKILHFLLSKNVIASERQGGEVNISNHVFWSDGTFLTVPEPTAVRLVSQPSSGIPQAQPAEEATGLNGREQEIYQLLSRLIKKVYQYVLSRKLRAIPAIRSYMKANSAESVAAAIVKAINPSALDVILSTEQFTTAR